MRTINLAALLLPLAVAACAGATSPPPSASARFDPSSVAWSKRTGANVIAGVARLEADNGKLRTCASLPVRLAPDSPYTRDRVERLYGDADAAFVEAREAQRARAEAGGGVTKAYEKSLKASVCDAQGRFAFKNLPDGTYYVMAPVVWRNKLGEVSEGGFFMQRVTVAGGETARIAMAM
jgi:hypothetical protein